MLLLSLPGTDSPHASLRVARYQKTTPRGGVIVSVVLVLLVDGSRQLWLYSHGRPVLREPRYALYGPGESLQETVVEGIDTTLSFHLQILADEKFRRGEIHTGYLDEFLAARKQAA